MIRIWFPNTLCIVLLYSVMLKKERKIPLEIYVHSKLYGKEPWEIDYGEKCPICNVRIDSMAFVLWF